MKFVIQRVRSASVTVEGRIAGSIQKGLLVLIGVGQEDTEAAADKYLKKLLGLRIFEDENGKTNLSLADVGGRTSAGLPVYPLRQLPQGQPSQLYRSRKSRIGGTAL